jgi:hypothetical protein
MPTTEVGTAYTYEGAAPIGRGNEGLPPGTQIEVRDIVPASMPGAHTLLEDSIVVVWQSPTIVNTANGNEVGYVQRALSVSVVDFDANFQGV